MLGEADNIRELHQNLTESESKFKTKSWDISGGPVAKTPFSQCRELGFDPWSRKWIPHATVEDRRLSMMQLRPSAAK